MNHIIKQKLENKNLKLQVQALKDGYNELRQYLNSPKFQGHENNFVNPDDIRLRIQEILSTVLSIEEA